MTRRHAPRAGVAAQALRRLLLLSACTCTTPWGSWRGPGSPPVPASASVLLPLERIDLERRVPPHPGRRALVGRPAAGMDVAESREVEVRSPGGTSIAADEELPVVGVDAGSGRSGLVTSSPVIVLLSQAAPQPDAQAAAAPFTLVDVLDSELAATASGLGVGA